jgi:hypothetical protein
LTGLESLAKCPNLNKCISADENWEELLGFLPADYEELANVHRQLQVQYGNAKITTARDLLRLILLHVGAGIGLRQTATLVGCSGGVSVSQVTVHKKMRRAGPYLQALVHRMAGPSMAARAELWDGYDIVAIDATTDSSPGSDGTDARLHSAIRLADLSVLFVEVTDQSGGETLKRYPLHEGQLALVDRGYSTGPGIAVTVRNGADVLVRLNRGALPLYEREGEQVEVLERLRSLSGRRAEEWPVEIRTKDGDADVTIPGRLMAVRLPEKEAEEARQRVGRVYGKETTETMLEAAGYVALFTTVPATRLSAARCIELYRLRWQVELLFKRWKSICGLDKLPNFRDDTIRAWILAKVLLALVLDRMGSSGAELFPPERLTMPDRWRKTTKRDASSL